MHSKKFYLTNLHSDFYVLKCLVWISRINVVCGHRWRVASVRRPEADSHAASGGFAQYGALIPDQGLCPWTPLGEPPPVGLTIVCLEHKECVVEIDKCVLRFNEIELSIFEPNDVGYFHSLEMLPHFIFS